MDEQSKNLFEAVLINDVYNVKKYIDLGADDNIANDLGNTALHEAASRGYTQTMQLLLKNGCSTNLKNNRDNTALHSAAYNEDIYALQLLLDYDCNPNHTNKQRRTALHIVAYYCNLGAIQLLLESGCNPNLKDYKRRTALHIAAYYCNLGAIQLLLESGCNPNLKDYKGKTALHIAAANSHADPYIIQILLKFDCEQDMEDNEGNTALNEATHLRYAQAMQILLENGCSTNQRNNQSETALHLAAYNGDEHALQLLLDKDCNPNHTNDQSRTALHIAAGHINIQAIQLLLERGCSPNHKDCQGKTALHVAAANNDADPYIIQILLKLGCEPNMKDNNGRTALHTAADNLMIYPNTMQVLLDYGCKPDDKDKQGKTALHLAASNGIDNSFIIKILLGCKPDEKDDEGRTALHFAAGKKFPKVNSIQILLDNCCKPDEKDKQGKTPYMLLKAKMTNEIEGYYRKEFAKAMKILKEYEEYWQLGLPVEVKDLDNKSAQVFASLLGEEGYEHYEARVMLAGEQGTGKTTIARYLVGQGPTNTRLSTDGIELYNGVSFIDRETEEWLSGKQDFTLSEIAISRSLRKDESTPKNQREKEKEKTDNTAFLTDELPQYSSHTQCLATNEQLPLNNSVNEDTDDVLENLSSNDKKHLEYESLGISTDFTIPEDSISINLKEKDGRPNTQYKANKEKSTFGESLNDDTDKILVAIIPCDDEHLVHESLVIKSDDDSLLDKSKNMQNVYSRNMNDTTQTYTDEITLQGKKTIITVAKEASVISFSNESTKETDSGDIKPSKDRLDENLIQTDELHVPAKETEECNQTAETFTEEIYPRENEEITPLPVLCETSSASSNDHEVQAIKSFEGQNDVFDSVECHSGTNTKSPEACLTTEVIKNPGIIGRLKKLFGIDRNVEEIKVSMTEEKFLQESLKVGRKKLHQRKIVPVIIWDFGGQDVFYSTHQTFLTYRAIYLLVLDGSRTLDDPCPYEQYLPGKSGNKTQRDYLKFWINTIVTYCKGSGPGFPKIMIVLTHKDKLKDVDVENRRQQLFNDIEKMFYGSPLLSHLVIKDQIFVNAKDGRDPEMAKIKKSIIEQAFHQPTWGQRLPKCFIPLELEFDSLLNRNISLITMEHLKKINSSQPVRPLTEDEMKVFLKFQHSVGRILYFDESNLNEYIILAPSHLIEAFKSIITDKRFCEGEKMRQESWDSMSKKGVIEKKSIEDIWKQKKYKKFQDHKDYLLGVMTHLDILVEPKRYDQSYSRIPSNFYYVASMVRTSDTTDYLRSSTFGQRNIGLAFRPSSSMIPPALSFRFISYCLGIFAVKKYGQKNDEMIFHRSAVLTIDRSLDMVVNCDDEIIIVRLVHAENRTLIMRDLATSIKECLGVALDKISQIYVKTSSTGPVTNKGSFYSCLCCSSYKDPCLLSMVQFKEQDNPWKCPKHGIDHTKDMLSAWDVQKIEIQCGVACPVNDNEFLMQCPTDFHLRRLSMQYSINETSELAIHLGMQHNTLEKLRETIVEEPERLNFEILRRCLDGSSITFNDIKKAVESGNIQNSHTLCKVVRGKPIHFDHEPEKWDLEPKEEHFDRLAPLVGNNSLALLVELGMDFNTWEHIRYRQMQRDLAKLNLDILQEWKSVVCKKHNIKPTLRHIGQAFNDIGKDIKIIENVLADYF